MKNNLIISFTIFLFFTVSSFACSCYTKSLQSNYENADLIFTGKVVEINRFQIIDSIPTPNGTERFEIRKYNRIEFTFEIKRLIKGKSETDVVTIATTGGITDCGNFFPLHTEHLVFSFITNRRLREWSSDRYVDPYLTTSTCTHTSRIKNVSPSKWKNLEVLIKADK